LSLKPKELLALEILDIYGQGSKREMLSDKSVPPVKRLRAHFKFMASRYRGFGFGKGWTELVATPSVMARLMAASWRVSTEVARFLINSWEGAVVRMKIVTSVQPAHDFFSIAFRC
jgi:TetR/AcrR family transcriptional repressor of nem operon